jgi:hypothetical protein
LLYEPDCDENLWAGTPGVVRRVAGLIVMTAVLLGCTDDGEKVAVGDVADQLPFAPTTSTTVELLTTTTVAAPTTTTAAPVTTTTTAPPPTTTTAPLPPPPTTVAASRAAPATSCHPSYDPCLPITGDLDCGDIGQTVHVIGPDDYRLDGDGDGFGCDS